jgi:wyosine [tRNA(Phe)-imidazoG37] synthetase (radical SAM superfamily)
MVENPDPSFPAPTPAFPHPYRHVFGPVASRRLGLSLGIDLVPMKTCSYDCVYCQLGPTRTRTVERREWVPTAEVNEEFADWLGRLGKADAVTLAGSGEPTLHTRFGEVLDAVRERCAIPTVLLTNGSLLHLPEVREAASRAHIVKVTFSAADEETWRRLHGPSPELSFGAFVEGVRRFRKEYAGELIFEAMMVSGINCDEPQVVRLADLVKTIGPDRVQINTPVRPPSDRNVCAPLPAELERIARLFDPPAEVVGGRMASVDSRLCSRRPSETEILALVARHPASSHEIARALGVDEGEAARLLKSLVREGRLQTRERKGETYYRGLEIADFKSEETK